MTTTYFRWHQTEIPAFSAEHAYSGLWGRSFSEDGAQSECPVCDGKGVDEFGSVCAECDGEGWEDCQQGYSCCDSAEELVEYIHKHLLGGDEGDPGDGEVIEFAGWHAGTGFDGESLVVPEKVINRMTWKELCLRVKHLGGDER